MNGFLFGAWLACQVLDTSTTAVGFSRGYIEANPSMSTKGFAIRVSANLLNVFIWRKETHRQQRWTSGAMALSGCLAGGSNLYQLKRMR